MCSLYSVSYLQMRKLKSRQKNPDIEPSWWSSQSLKKQIHNWMFSRHWWRQSEMWPRFLQATFRAWQGDQPSLAHFLILYQVFLGNLCVPFFFFFLTFDFNCEEDVWASFSQDSVMVGNGDDTIQTFSLYKLCLHPLSSLGRIEHKTQALIGDSGLWIKHYRVFCFYFSWLSAK